VKDDKDGETMIESRQRLSKCSLQLAKARPWLGKSGRLRRRRTIRKPRPPQTQDNNVKDEVTGHLQYKTRSGCTVRRLARLIQGGSPEGKGGGVVRSYVLLD